jgi:hypothetical protein
LRNKVIRNGFGPVAAQRDIDRVNTAVVDVTDQRDLAVRAGLCRRIS